MCPVWWTLSARDDNAHVEGWGVWEVWEGNATLMPPPSSSVPCGWHRKLSGQGGSYEAAYLATYPSTLPRAHKRAGRVP